MSNSGGEGTDYDDTSSVDGEEETALNTLIVGARKFDPTLAARKAGVSAVGTAFRSLKSINNKVTQSATTAAKGVHRKASNVTDGIKSEIKRRVSTTSKGDSSVMLVLSSHLSSGDTQSIEDKMLELRLEIIDKVLGDAERQEKTQWLSNTTYEDSDEKLSYKEQAEFLLKALQLLGVHKDTLEPDLAKTIEGLDRKAVIKCAEKFIADYQENVKSALKDGDYMGRYAEKYSDISTTMFCALIILVYNMLLMTKRSSAHDFATAMVSLADGSAPTRTIKKQLDSIEAESKDKDTPAAIALAMAGGALLLNGSASTAAILVALALATPAPGRINKQRVIEYIHENLRLEVSTARIAGISTLNLAERIKRLTRGVTAPKKKG
jgi:hypothetical protein